MGVDVDTSRVWRDLLDFDEKFGQNLDSFLDFDLKLLSNFDINLISECNLNSDWNLNSKSLVSV